MFLFGWCLLMVNGKIDVSRDILFFFFGLINRQNDNFTLSFIKVHGNIYYYEKLIKYSTCMFIRSKYVSPEKKTIFITIFRFFAWFVISKIEWTKG